MKSLPEEVTLWGKCISAVLALWFSIAPAQVPGSRKWLQRRLQSAWFTYRDTRPAVLIDASEQRLLQHMDASEQRLSRQLAEIGREQKDMRVQMAEDARRNEEAHEMLTKDQIEANGLLTEIQQRLEEGQVGTRAPRVVEIKAKAAGAS